MGKAARWFRSFLGKKDQQATKDQRRHHLDQAPPPPPAASAKRWSFGKSSRDSAEAAAAAAAATVTAGKGNAAIARAAEAAWLRSAAACAETETDREREQSKHAIAVAAATAAAADAAVAAAQAAVAVVRLTSKGRAPSPGAGGVLAAAGGRSAAAAVRIQTAFRGFLAKKALRALKALVKLQALVRGYLVRRQAAATLQSMQALVRAQAAVRARRAAAAAAALLPHLHHPPPVRPRYSLQERYADDTRSEHGVAAYSRRSVESSSYGGYDRSPKIVEVDPGRPRPRSSSSRRASSPLSSGGEDWCAANPLSSSPLPCYLSSAGGAPAPPRIAVPTSRQFPDHDWCALEKARPATAQSTPRYLAHAPPTPAKSVAGGGGYYSPSLHPNYMSSTQASEAKARSQSAPKQRPDLACCGGAAGAARKRVPLSEVVVVEASRASLSGVVGVQPRGGCGGGARAAQEAFSFRAAVVGRMDRALEVAGIENDRLAFLQRRW